MVTGREGGVALNVTVDDDRCCGHGMCLTMCPEVFFLTGDGYADVNTAALSDVSLEMIQEAARVCPEQAIVITPERE
jgi:ferredoxin